MAKVTKQRVLILCTGNSARSQLAEGWLRALGGERFAVFSAGTDPKPAVHPLAIQVMSDAGIDLTASPAQGRAPVSRSVVRLHHHRL